MTEWNDGRLDDLSKRVDRIETKMDRGFGRVDQRFEQVHQDMRELHGRFDSLQQTLLRGALGMTIGLLSVSAALAGVILTQA